MEKSRMNREKLESELTGLLCFLTVSARELMNEPKIYGPMRLVEAAQRLAELAEASGLDHGLLAEASQRIDAFPLDALPEGEEEFVRFLDDLILLLATRVKES
jgi:hypothetical protein